MTQNKYTTGKIGSLISGQIFLTTSLSLLRVPGCFMFQHAKPVQSPAEQTLYVELGKQHGRDYEQMATAWNSRLAQLPELSRAGVTAKTARLLKEYSDQLARALEVGHLT